MKIFLFGLILFFTTHMHLISGAKFNDVHFHLTNYIQKGISLKRFISIMNEAHVERAAVFGIPLHQKWDYSISGDRDPDYYLQSNAPLYYYSFVDAMIANDYQKLSKKEQARIDPMITGFNPTDMYAAEHIQRVLEIYPGIFTGIGEFVIHKEFVSSKVLGQAASLKNQALKRVFNLCAEVGLIALIHVDINNLMDDDVYKPSHFKDIYALFKNNKETTIIWAHTGLGRFVKPSEDHLILLEKLIKDPDLKNLYFDISWDEVAKYVVKNEKTVTAWAKLINKYPSKFLFGTDSIAPKTTEQYLKTYNSYQALWEKLTPEAQNMVTKTNYEKLFNTARKKVRTWEEKNHLKSR